MNTQSTDSSTLEQLHTIQEEILKSQLELKDLRAHYSELENTKTKFETEYNLLLKRYKDIKNRFINLESYNRIVSNQSRIQYYTMGPAFHGKGWYPSEGRNKIHFRWMGMTGDLLISTHGLEDHFFIKTLVASSQVDLKDIVISCAGVNSQNVIISPRKKGFSILSEHDINTDSGNYVTIQYRSPACKKVANDARQISVCFSGIIISGSLNTIDLF